MRAVIVYESMYGNTHVVADHIAEGLRPMAEVDVVPVDQASRDAVASADLVVVGGPTHAHGMTTRWSRKAAMEAAAKPGAGLEADPDAEGDGLRAWFDHLGSVEGVAAAAFDTRIDGPPLFTGRASRGITRRLRHHGFVPAAEPESFLVDSKHHLVAGEVDRATAWGRTLAAALAEIERAPSF
jgi:hypothetical protein